MTHSPIVLGEQVAKASIQWPQAAVQYERDDETKGQPSMCFSWSHTQGWKRAPIVTFKGRVLATSELTQFLSRVCAELSRVWRCHQRAHGDFELHHEEKISFRLASHSFLLAISNNEQSRVFPNTNLAMYRWRILLQWVNPVPIASRESKNNRTTWLL